MTGFVPICFNSAIFTKGNSFYNFLLASLDEEALPKWGSFLNTIALRKAKIVYSFGLSECNRVKDFALCPLIVNPIQKGGKNEDGSHRLRMAKFHALIISVI